MNPRHVTAAFAIAYVHYVSDGTVTLNVNRIRTWVHRDKVARVGTDADGFALYNLADIVKMSGVSLDG